MSKPNTLSISKRKLILAIISIVLICSIASSSVVYVMAQGGGSTPITISSGPYPGAPTYTIFIDGGIYYAKNAYGAMIYSGTNAEVILSDASNAIGAIGGSLTVMAGLYQMTTTWTLTGANDGIQITFMAGAILQCDANGVIPLFINGILNATITGLTVDGNSAHYATGAAGFYVEGCMNSTFSGGTVYHCTNDGVYTQNSQRYVWNNWNIYNCGANGFHAYQCQGETMLQDVRAYSNSQVGIQLDMCSYWSLISCYGVGNTQHGFQLEKSGAIVCSYDSLISCYAIGNTINGFISSNGIGQVFNGCFAYDDNSPHVQQNGIFLINTDTNDIVIGCQTASNTNAGIKNNSPTSQIHSSFNNNVWVT